MDNKKLRKATFDLNKPYLKTLYWFFSYPNQRMSLNEVAKKTGASKTSAKKAVTMLIKEGFLKKESVGKAWLLSCNQEHYYNYSRKIAYNLMMIHESGILREIRELVRNPKAVILFGSYRKGDDTEKSDIDIAVEMSGSHGLKISNLGIIPELGFRKNVEVNLHIFSRDKIDLNLFSNIANGIVLEGFLEVKA